jgi:hypothetical protein
MMIIAQLSADLGVVRFRAWLFVERENLGRESLSSAGNLGYVPHVELGFSCDLSRVPQAAYGVL